MKVWRAWKTECEFGKFCEYCKFGESRLDCFIHVTTDVRY